MKRAYKYDRRARGTPAYLRPISRLAAISPLAPSFLHAKETFSLGTHLMLIRTFNQLSLGIRAFLFAAYAAIWRNNPVYGGVSRAINRHQAARCR